MGMILLLLLKSLDCLIYGKDAKKDAKIKDEILENYEERTWQASKENISFQVWEGKAKIKVRVP